jgi:hypothetical protein
LSNLSADHFPSQKWSGKVTFKNVNHHWHIGIRLAMFKLFKLQKAQDKKELIYSTSTPIILGGKFWIWAIGLLPLINSFVLSDFVSFRHFREDGLANFIYANGFYGLFVIYLYTKNFFISKNEMGVYHKLFGYQFFIRYLPLKDVKFVTLINHAFRPKKGKSLGGQIDFLNFIPKFWSFGFGQKISIPIPSQNPIQFFKSFLEIIYDPKILSLAHPKGQIPLRSSQILGRVTFPKFLKEESTVGRNHAQIQIENQTTFVIDLKSKNKTTLNGLTLTPNLKFPLKVSDHLKLGSCEFDVVPFLWQDTIKVTEKTLGPTVLVRKFLKQAGIFISIIVIFIPSLIFYLIQTKSQMSLAELRENPSLNNLKQMALTSLQFYQTSNWEKAAPLLDFICQYHHPDFQNVDQICLKAAISYKHLKKIDTEKKFLSMSCLEENDGACARLGIIKGENFTLEEALKRLVHQCTKEKLAASCLELAVINAGQNLPQESLDYILLASEFGNSVWTKLTLDPELEPLRKTPVFQEFWNKAKVKFLNFEKQLQTEPDFKPKESELSAFEEFLKAYYLAPFHRQRLGQICPIEKIKEGELCYPRFQNNFKEYIKRVDTLSILRAHNWAQDVLNHDDKFVTSPHKGIHILNMMEEKLTLMDMMNLKSKVKIMNLVGHIFYYSKFYFPWWKEINKSIKELKLQPALLADQSQIKKFNELIGLRNKIREDYWDKFMSQYLKWKEQGFGQFGDIWEDEGIEKGDI